MASNLAVAPTCIWIPNVDFKVNLRQSTLLYTGVTYTNYEYNFGRQCFFKHLYTPQSTVLYVGDSLELLDQLEPNSIDLVITSPPFALQVRKLTGMLKIMLNG